MYGLCLYVSSHLDGLPILIRKAVYMDSGQAKISYHVDAKTLDIKCKGRHNDTITSLQRHSRKKYQL